MNDWRIELLFAFTTVNRTGNLAPRVQQTTATTLRRLKKLEVAGLVSRDIRYSAANDFCWSITDAGRQLLQPKADK